jgi:hypothetical protein
MANFKLQMPRPVSGREMKDDSPHAMLNLAFAIRHSKFRHATTGSSNLP